MTRALPARGPLDREALTRTTLPVLAALPTLAALALATARPDPATLALAGAVALVTGGAVAVSLVGTAGCAAAVFGLGIVTTSWNGVVVGGSTQVGDLLFAAALLLALAAVALRPSAADTPRSTVLDAVRALPVWLVVPALTLVLLTVAHQWWPVESSYLASRHVEISSVVQWGGRAQRVVGDAVNAARWEIAVVALPLLAVLVARTSRVRVETLVGLWVLGVSVSACVAITDAVGLTAIGQALVPLQTGGRQSGLTSHLNQLGVAVVMALPAALWLFVARARVLAAPAAVVLVGGAFLSGSRGAAVTAVLTTLLTLAVAAWQRWGTAARRGAPWLAVLAAAATAVAVTGGDLAAAVGRGRRSELTSNSERLDVARQGLEDWLHRPVQGIGLEVLTQAHDIYLQMLASGGVVLLLACLLMFGGAVAAGWRWRAIEHGLPLALGLSVLTMMIVGTVENQVAERYQYLPLALLLCCRESARRGAAPVTTPTPIPHPGRTL